jgi:hypothetical protein
VKNKRQKVNEKKARAKARKAEAALRQFILNDESERERLWILDSLKPTPDDIERALADPTAAHPMLHRMLMTVDSLFSTTTLGVDLPSLEIVKPVLRRLILSPIPLTQTSLNTAISDHIFLKSNQLHSSS